MLFLLVVKGGPQMADTEDKRETIISGRHSELEALKRNYRSSIAFRSIAGICALLVIFAIVVVMIGYSNFSEGMLNQYEKGAIQTANTAALMFKGDDVYRLSQSEGKTTEYKKIFSNMASLCNSSGSTFIYVIIPDTTDYNHITFLFSTIDYNTDYDLFPFGYVRETTNDEYRVKYRKLMEKKSHAEIVVRDQGDSDTDDHITAMVPVTGSDNKVKALVCVQRQLDVMEEVRKDYVDKVLLTLILLLLMVIIGVTLYLHFTLLDPLTEITSEAQRFAEENTQPDSKLTDSIHNKDEIGLLAASIDMMEDRVEDYIQRIRRITAESERMEAELALASEIQESMLPKGTQAVQDRNEFDIYASMTPAREVGGDFYNYFMVDEDHLALVIADVSGKGVPAALYMMVCTTLIRNSIAPYSSPAEVLEAVNGQLCDFNEQEMFVTVWLGILNIRTGIMTASNGGHEYPILRRPDGQFELLKDRHGFVLGGMEEAKYIDYTVEMPDGTCLFVYTDGLPEANNPDENMFGVERIIDVLNESPEGDPRELLTRMNAAAESYMDGTAPFDDLTMLCIESHIKKD